MTTFAPARATAYKKKDFNLSGLKGISDRTLEMHFKLYAGYVAQTNLLNEHIAELLRAGKTSTPEYAELKRRLSFEYNGMVLHEYYFGNLKPKATDLNPRSGVARAISQTFGNTETWRKDFQAVGEMRGVGWAILFQDPATDMLTNQWITLHEFGSPAGFKPLLVMDVWEHAFLLDYPPSERTKYIEAFFQNIDWDAVEQRFREPAASRPTG
jgi:Fe-Mn family superoxide dismutase